MKVPDGHVLVLQSLVLQWLVLVLQRLKAAACAAKTKGSTVVTRVACALNSTERDRDSNTVTDRQTDRKRDTDTDTDTDTARERETEHTPHHIRAY